MCGIGEMWEITLEDGLEALVGVRCPLPMKGRLMMCLDKSAREQGVRSEKAKRRSPWWEKNWKRMVESFWSQLA